MDRYLKTTNRGPLFDVPVKIRHADLFGACFLQRVVDNSPQVSASEVLRSHLRTSSEVPFVCVHFSGRTSFVENISSLEFDILTMLESAIASRLRTVFNGDLRRRHTYSTHDRRFVLLGGEGKRAEGGQVIHSCFRAFPLYFPAKIVAEGCEPEFRGDEKMSPC